MAGKSPREAAQARAKRRQARARIRKGTKTGAYKPKSLGRDMLSLGGRLNWSAFPGGRKKTPKEMRKTKYPRTK